jgi:agmatinase
MNYLDLPPEFASFESAEYCILQVPYERTTTYKKGTRNAPREVIEASHHLEDYDDELDMEPYRAGIFTVPRLDFAENLREEDCLSLIYRDTRSLLARNKFIIAIGGEHSLTYGLVRAYRERYPDLTVLQLDAHADLRQVYYGSRFNHACAMARVRELAPVVHVGIRALSKPEMDWIRREGFRIWFARDMIRSDDWMEEVLQALSGPVYLTFDVDYFDPSVLPATGAPEPGGLGWYPTMRFLRRLFAEKKVVGADVVELLPQPGDHASAFTVAKLVYKMIGYREAARQR